MTDLCQDLTDLARRIQLPMAEGGKFVRASTDSKIPYEPRIVFSRKLDNLGGPAANLVSVGVLELCRALVSSLSRQQDTIGDCAFVLSSHVEPVHNYVCASPILVYVTDSTLHTLARRLKEFVSVCSNDSEEERVCALQSGGRCTQRFYNFNDAHANGIFVGTCVSQSPIPYLRSAGFTDDHILPIVRKTTERRRKQLTKIQVAAN